MTSANSQHSSEQREPEKKIKSIIKKKKEKKTPALASRGLRNSEMRFHGVKHKMPLWPPLRSSVKDRSTNPLAFVYF